MEEGVEAHAETMWILARGFRAMHPHMEPHLGAKDAWIEKAIVGHCSKVEKASTCEQACLQYDDFESVDMAMGRNS